MFFKSLFERKRHPGKNAANYASVVDFVDDNVDDVKALLSSVGYNDVGRRLADMAAMTHCHVMALCQKLNSPNKFMVVESSDAVACPRGTVFSWTHTQPSASADTPAVVSALPFNVVGARGFISVPVKNERNMLSGILLGIAAAGLSGLDGKVRLLHILAPTFDAEVRCVRLKQDLMQSEQRIVSLNQNIEVLNSDLRKAQDKVQESREMKSTFLTNLSHEIRTPMNAIIGFVDLLGQARTDEERDNFIEIVRQNSRQLLHVIDSLIEISKLQSSYMLKPVCPVQLNDLLTGIKIKYQDELRKMGKDVVIETSFSLDTPNDTIWGSDEIISRVLGQILDNACRVTMEGKISISYSINHRDATFCVTDTGPGLPPGVERSVFNMFDNASMDDAGKGKGIGLAVAAKYLTLCDGRIWVDTEYKGGACFYFSIPTEKL